MPRQPCYVSYVDREGNRWQRNTFAASLFDGAMQAIREFAEARYARKPYMDTILEIETGWAHERKTYYVSAKRVVEHFGFDPKEWLRE